MDADAEKLLRKIQHSIPLDILDDLVTRFIINVPIEAKQNFIRICFQIELAHWFYLDFYVSNDERCKSCSINEFALHVFQQIPSLQAHADRLDAILEEWRLYKQSVPTYGAILLSEDLTHVLLVQSYWAKSSWGFPKGKVNEDEEPQHCAVREVMEETGFDISKHLDPDLYLESVINEQLVRLYVITGISRETKFQPKTRYEIKACEWFPIADLPTNKKDYTPKIKMGVSPNAFFMVLPFVKRIKSISQNFKPNRRRHKSASVSEGESINGKNNLKIYQKVDTDDIYFKNNKVKSEKKNAHSKRKLFSNAQDEFQFTAPSWLNFKFDKIAILECIP